MNAKLKAVLDAARAFERKYYEHREYVNWGGDSTVIGWLNTGVNSAESVLDRAIRAYADAP